MPRNRIERYPLRTVRQRYINACDAAHMDRSAKFILPRKNQKNRFFFSGGTRWISEFCNVDAVK